MGAQLMAGDSFVPSGDLNREPDVGDIHRERYEGSYESVVSEPCDSTSSEQEMLEYCPLRPTISNTSGLVRSRPRERVTSFTRIEGLDRDNLDNVFEPSKVADVARIEGQTSGTCRRRNEEVNGARATGLASSCRDRGEDPSVGSSGLYIERKRIKDGLCPLKTVLSSSTFIGIVGGVWASCEFGHRQRTHREFNGEACSVNLFEINDDRSVDDASCVANWFRHGVPYPVTPRRRDRSADDSSRRWVPP